ncbi:MAG: hypothetical protein IJQ07_05735 [Clostridia bacterium]|nr:hypothetical protein [Clostridia bacterium]
MHNDWSRRERGIKNIVARSYWCWNVRLLPIETVIENVVIDNVIDTWEYEVGGGILIGEADASYGRVLSNSTKNVVISKVIANKTQAVLVKGYLTNSFLTNVINREKNGQIIRVIRANVLDNVIVC